MQMSRMHTNKGALRDAYIMSRTEDTCGRFRLGARIIYGTAVFIKSVF